MKLLVLGGTVFLSKAVAAEAAARGHDVVAVSRGVSGAVPPGVRHVVADRDAGLPAAFAAEPFDAVVDVARRPSHVRTAVAAVPHAHWVFVSTINVYADEATPGGRPGTLALRAPVTEDADGLDPATYGGMKVACEEIVRAGAAGSTVVRPGLVVGPGDPTGRFTYWVARLARAATEPGAPVLAPGDPADLVQVVDVRDLATWLVDLAQARTDAVLDAVAPPVPLGELLADVAAGCGAAPRWRWAPRGALEAAGVAPWSGARSLPLWLPRPELGGMAAHDVAASLAAGLRPRPVAETARDTLAWLRATPGATVTGLTAAEEAEVLRVLDGRPGA
jgi:nucleoside-diphosphate-sugar epimerase